MAGLLVANGSQAQTFAASFTVGRRADLTITDDYASPCHANFIYDGTDWYVQDAGSTNGTRVLKPGQQWYDGISAAYAVRLAKGDRVRIGRTILTVVPA